MKARLFCLGLSLWCGAGCVTLPSLQEEPEPAAIPAVARPARSRPPVTADSISETNAHEKASALLEELDREAERDAAVQLENLD